MPVPQDSQSGLENSLLQMQELVRVLVVISAGLSLLPRFQAPSTSRRAYSYVTCNLSRRNHLNVAANLQSTLIALYLLTVREKELLRKQILN